MKENKRKISLVTYIIALIVLFIIIVVFLTIIINKNKNNTIVVNNIENASSEKLKKLPLPEITGGQRGELGIDKNINETTIDEYLNREDAVYRDMRMLEDPGNYENIGGDRFLSGYVDGF